MQRGLAQSHFHVTSGLINVLWKSIRQHIAAVDRTLALWHARAESRREISKLDEQLQKDLRLDSVELDKEARKPFWRA